MSSTRTRKSTKTVEAVEAPAPAPAPVVEAAPVEVEAVAEVNETFESTMATLVEKMAARAVLDKEINALVKSIPKLHAREVKAGGKSKRSQPKKDRDPSGFAKATPVPEALRKFLKLEAGIELPRTEVAKHIYSYIRDQDLRDKQDKRIIHPDAQLRKLFSLKEGEILDFKNFQKQLSLHYPKAASKVKAEAVAEVKEEVKEEVPVVAPVATEGGSRRRARNATTAA